MEAEATAIDPEQTEALFRLVVEVEHINHPEKGIAEVHQYAREIADRATAAAKARGNSLDRALASWRERLAKLQNPRRSSRKNTKDDEAPDPPPRASPRR